MLTMRTPAQQAETLIAEAEAEFGKGAFDQSYRYTGSALGLRRMVENYPAEIGFPVRGDTARDHRLYTDVMRRAFVLLLKLGKFDEAEDTYGAALVWADDPECSSQKLFTTIQADWQNRAQHERAGTKARKLNLWQWLMTWFS